MRVGRPDYCNMVSFRKETFGVFGLPAPPYHPQPRTNKTTIWPQACADGVATELETGQVLINKRKSWVSECLPPPHTHTPPPHTHTHTYTHIHTHTLYPHPHPRASGDTCIE